jgi:hypothetical protein
MKKLITTLTLLLMFSSPSYAEWTKVSEGELKNTYYVDFDRIRKIDGYVYFWVLEDLLKADSSNNLSAEAYLQADCKLFREKVLSWSKWTYPMGEGVRDFYTTIPDKNWTYPSPESSSETVLNAVCNHIKKKWWQIW